MEPATPKKSKEMPEVNSQPASNIFSSPLGKRQRDKASQLKKKNQIKAYIQIGISVLALGLYGFFFLYNQVPAYLNFSSDYAHLQEQVDEKEATIANLKEERDAHKSAYDSAFEEDQKIINSVLPEETDKLGVIRLMENFATHLNTVYPPFEFTSITFSEPVEENGYTVLPFRTSIHASTTNFERFLGLVNLSGDISPENPDHIRLMEISNISLNYRGVDKEGEDQGVDFNVELKAYSR